MASTASTGRWLAAMLALAGLNLSLTFHNLWPTPWVTTRHQLSVELAVVLMGMALYARWQSVIPARMLSALAALFTLACIGRYAQVTAPALYGRPVDLFWDARHLPRVATMLAEATAGWMVPAAALALVALLAVLFLTFRTLLGAVARALTGPTPRRIALGLGGAVVAVYLLGQGAPGSSTGIWFSLPLSITASQQLARLHRALSDDGYEVDAPPLPVSDLRRVSGAHVMIFFLESYGAATFDRPDMLRALAGRRAALADTVQRTGHVAVSTFVTSPTYGGSSWLAHASFLSGIEVRDNGTYQQLLTRERETLVHRFAAHGYRTLGLMPGLRQPWPEGAFYGYRHIYDAAGLDYRGPAFGWWRIPDQYALAQLDHHERRAGARAPLLLVFPTISTHSPFRPVPPYQPDWSAMGEPAPFPPAQLRTALDARPQWSDLGPSYVDSVNYALTLIAGYLQRHADDDLVLILMGDHQPPAIVSGPDQPWDVPVHVITKRAHLIRALLAEGFTPGMIPRRPVLGPMHGLTPRILRAFGG